MGLAMEKPWGLGVSLRPKWLGVQGVGGESWAVRQDLSRVRQALRAEEWSWTFICETGKVLGRLEEACPGEGWVDAGVSREGPGGGMACGLSREILAGDAYGLESCWAVSVVKTLPGDGSQGRGVWRARETGEQLLGGAGFPREEWRTGSTGKGRALQRARPWAPSRPTELSVINAC